MSHAWTQAGKQWHRKLSVHELYLLNHPSRPCRATSYGEISNSLANLKKKNILDGVVWVYFSCLFQSLQCCDMRGG